MSKTETQSRALQLADACADDWHAVRSHLVVAELRRLDAENKALREMLEAAPAAPAGWKLVPAKPTDAMLSAAQKAWLADPLRRSSTLYAAALAAAPLAAAKTGDAA